jgi:hypothetical protein
VDFCRFGVDLEWARSCFEPQGDVFWTLKSCLLMTPTNETFEWGVGGSSVSLSGVGWIGYGGQEWIWSGQEWIWSGQEWIWSGQEWIWSGQEWIWSGQEWIFGASVGLFRFW